MSNVLVRQLRAGALPVLSAFALLLLALAPVPATAQEATGSLSLAVTTNGDAPPHYEIEIVGTALGTLTSEDGRFTVGGLRPGSYVLLAQGLGFSPSSQDIEIRPGETLTVEIILEQLRFAAPGVVVTAVRPDLRPEATLAEQQIREANPIDVGEMIRELPGVDSVRRGQLGLDPVVRGLRETQVGVYLDDARIFPAGPGRMDSALSHFDPSTVRSVEVVKGPYALTWGAGNLTSVRAETMPLPHAVPGPIHGHVWGGYGSNTEAAEGIGHLFGTSESVSWWAGGSYRTGSDYEDGDGNLVPGDYRSAEGRGKVGFALGAESFLQVTGAYQEQNDIDYPGRVLDATFFKARYVAANYDYANDAGTSIHASGYWNDVDHEMNNDEKPTAQAMPGRVPPFPLDIDVITGSRTWGGRAVAEFDASDTLRVETGLDTYTANRNATRRIGRRDTGMTVAQDVPWPDVDIRDTGLFAKGETRAGGVNLAATARLDLVSSTADESLMSDFFLASTEGPYDVDETNFSGAVTVSAPLSTHWNLAGGIGSAVRTASALERYSDRFPSSKMQSSAEFMGNPQLLPERSTQFDLWLDGRYRAWSINLGGFYRDLSDNITIEPTDLPKKLPLSPPVVFRYINGDARYWGFEGNLTYSATRALGLFASTAYLWGEDQTLDEPAFGVSPFRVDLGARYEPFGGAWHAQAMVHLVAEQDRVAAQRFETPTDGYTTVDLSGGWRTGTGFELLGGVRNLLDEFYVNHLNAKNPFTGQQIPEPGRVVYLRAIYSF